MKSGLAILDEHKGGSCAKEVCLNIATDEKGVPAREFRGRAAIVTLGCAKNQVDSEVMLGVLRSRGYEIVSEISSADVAIVNTCGFLESAIKESIDSILEVAEQKEKGRLRKLIVAGCMVSRYKDELKKTMPEVDDFISTEEILKVGDAADEGVTEIFHEAARPYFLYDDTMPRQLASKSHMAYVKIAEGCNRPCTFCIIPKIRGSMRSRALDSVVREVSLLGAQGVREINLVAQDLTSYGTDIKGPKLADLLRALDKNGAVDWIRLLYAYPIGIDEDLIDAVMELPRVCEYLDLPLQHASEKLLKEMKRPLGRYAPRQIVEFMKKRQPKLNLRTTFIVGFPGESDEDVAELEAFIKDGHFSSVGIFTYSPEQGTPAHAMPGQLAQEVKDERRDRLMKAQQAVVEKRLLGYVGETLDGLIEGLHEDTDLLVTARTRFQAPDVDGIVIINDIPNLGDGVLPESRIGTIGRVEITEIAGYDLVGTLVGERISP